MKHVADRMAAWLGGELDAAAAASLEAHLRGCEDCRREAEALRATWNALDIAPAPLPAGSVWPAVRARTLGARPRGWFFGGSPAARGALAAATLAVGVLGGRLTGGLSGPREALADDDGNLAAVWLEESTWHDESGGGLAESWLALASDEGTADRTGGTGGTQ
ncbi:MAG: zf-HC2 domain-containing protein [bacterium]|nr:zf-HC2 domain-containing protein [bacterium]